MDNFNAHKWFKKQYLAEDKSDEDKVVAKGDGIEITKKQMERLQKGYPVRLSNGSVLASPFVKEGHTEDKDQELQQIKRFDQLSDDDKLKLAKIQAMMDRERSLREDDLDEIAFGAAGTDKRTGQVVGEIIELIISTGVDVYEVMEELGQEFGMDVRP